MISVHDFIRNKPNQIEGQCSPSKGLEKFQLSLRGTHMILRLVLDGQVVIV